MRTPVRTYLFKNHENVWRIPQKALSLHVMRHKIFQTRYFGYALLALACLLTACSGGSSSEEFDSPTPDPTPSPTPENQEIKLNASVWNMMEGMRASTYDDQAAIQTEGHFTCTVYQANTTTPYINTTIVDWNGDPTNKWLFSDGKHYWPASGSLDFFAYMPATKPSYISTITYAVSGTPVPAPQFVCADMPMTYNSASPTEGQGSGLQEFVWGVTIGQNKVSQGTSGVTMKFRHPFARIKFQLSASHPDIQINSITFKGLKTGGTCTFTNTDIADTYYYTTSVWSSLTPSEGGSNLVMTLATKSGDDYVAAPVNTFNNNPVSVVPIGGWGGEPASHQYVDLLMVPQTFAGEIEVNASWKDWGDTAVPHTVTTTIPSITWQAGYSYTYTFTITPEDLVVNLTDFTEQW